MNELVAVLMSWAVSLSGYSTPETLPEVKLVSQQWLREQACDGRNCRVRGWSPPGEVIYLDETLDLRNDTAASSILVHELVHYLQRESGKFGNDCAAAVIKEREAYAAQRNYMAAYGLHAPMLASLHGLKCERELSAPVTVDPGNTAR